MKAKEKTGLRIKKQNQENLMITIQVTRMKRLWIIPKFMTWETRCIAELLSRIKNTR